MVMVVFEGCIPAVYGWTISRLSWFIGKYVHFLLKEESKFDAQLGEGEVCSAPTEPVKESIFITVLIFHTFYLS